MEATDNWKARRRQASICGAESCRPIRQKLKKQLGRVAVGGDVQWGGEPAPVVTGRTTGAGRN